MYTPMCRQCAGSSRIWSTQSFLIFLFKITNLFSFYISITVPNPAPHPSLIAFCPSVPHPHPLFREVKASIGSQQSQHNALKKDQEPPHYI